MTATITRAEADRLTRTLIAGILGITPDAVTIEHQWHHELGSMDEGARCVTWLRDYRPSREEPDADWPGYLPTLLTEGSAGA